MLLEVILSIKYGFFHVLFFVKIKNVFCKNLYIMINKILFALKTETNYYKLLEIALNTKALHKSIANAYRRNETPQKKAKIIYLLIKKANKLNTKLNLDEFNYKKKVNQIFSKKTPAKKTVSKKKVNTVKKKIPINIMTVTVKDTEEIIPPKKIETKPVKKQNKIPAFIQELEKGEKTNEQYAKWFYKQPKLIQKIYKEKGSAYRKRGKLHRQCKEITGNSVGAISKRKKFLEQMETLTLKIKQLHSITEHYEKTGKIIRV